MRRIHMTRKRDERHAGKRSRFDRAMTADIATLGHGKHHGLLEERQAREAIGQRPETITEAAVELAGSDGVELFGRVHRLQFERDIRGRLLVCIERGQHALAPRRILDEAHTHASLHACGDAMGEPVRGFDARQDVARFMQIRIAVACALRFTREAHASMFDLARWPALDAHAARCEALPVFRSIAQVFAPPK